MYIMITFFLLLSLAYSSQCVINNTITCTTNCHVCNYKDECLTINQYLLSIQPITNTLVEIVHSPNFTNDTDSDVAKLYVEDISAIVNNQISLCNEYINRNASYDNNTVCRKSNDQCTITCETCYDLDVCSVAISNMVVIEDDTIHIQNVTSNILIEQISLILSTFVIPTTKQVETYCQDQINDIINGTCKNNVNMYLISLLAFTYLFFKDKN